MRDVFNSATSFNQDLSDWNVSAVTNMIMPLVQTPRPVRRQQGLDPRHLSKNPNLDHRTWSAHHTRPAHVVPSAANLRMLWVQPGTFIPHHGQPDHGSRARGIQRTISSWQVSAEHNVTLTEGFYLGKYEVTQAEV